MVTTSQVDMTPLDAPVCKAVGRKASLLLGLGSDRSRLVIATTGENNVVIRNNSASERGARGGAEWNRRGSLELELKGRFPGRVPLVNLGQRLRVSLAS